jgi:8-oxo-dGTP pyrophosphatase MutT (NUDIX family)
MKRVTEHSAGGVVYRKRKSRTANREPLWLVAKHSGYKKWVLPKGIVEEGEGAEETAVREVEEETGIKAKIVKKLTPDVTYKYRKGGTLVDKRVEFFLMKYQSGSIRDQCWEMEEVRWVGFDEAIELLAFPGERKVLGVALDSLSTLCDSLFHSLYDKDQRRTL